MNSKTIAISAGLGIASILSGISIAWLLIEQPSSASSATPAGLAAASSATGGGTAAGFQPASWQHNPQRWASAWAPSVATSVTWTVAGRAPQR